MNFPTMERRDWLRLAMVGLVGTTLTRTTARPPWTVTLTWDASPAANVAGYRLYSGRAIGDWTQQQDMGDVTMGTVTVETAGRWLFAVTAYNTAREEGERSAALVVRLPRGLLG